jgi:hypothetical protein
MAITIRSEGAVIMAVNSLTNSQVAFLYTHLVLARKFMMLPAHHKMKGSELVYQLLDVALQVIKFRIDGNS